MVLRSAKVAVSVKMLEPKYYLRTWLNINSAKCGSRDETGTGACRGPSKELLLPLTPSGNRGIQYNMFMLFETG